MFAIIETGGKQYRVAEGVELFIEKLNVEAESEVVFDKVLMVNINDDDTALHTISFPIVSYPE